MSIAKAFALAAALAVPAAAQGPSPDAYPQGSALPPLRFTAVCEIVGEEVVGYLRNESDETYFVEGPVKFAFHSRLSMSREEMQMIGNGIVTPGQTVVVARGRLTAPRGEEEQCRLDVSGAVRRG